MADSNQAGGTQRTYLDMDKELREKLDKYCENFRTTIRNVIESGVEFIVEEGQPIVPRWDKATKRLQHVPQRYAEWLDAQEGYTGFDISPNISLRDAIADKLKGDK